LQRGRKKYEAVDALPPGVGDFGGEECAHGQAADDDPLTAPRQDRVGRQRAFAPVRSRGPGKIGLGAAMAGELYRADSVAGVAQSTGQRRQFRRRAAEPVDEQHAERPTEDPLRSVVRRGGH
jgi:hypothetical protein